MRNRKTRSTSTITIWFLLCSACLYFILKNPVNKWLTRKSHPQNTAIILSEAFFTEKASPDKNNTINTLALWHGPSGQHWVIAAAKNAHKLFVYDAASGNKIKEFGSFGKSLMQLASPKGVAIVDNLIFVVEQNNHRIQVFTLPEFTCVGCAGEENLVRPSDITIYKTKPDTYIAYVTDCYKTELPSHLNQQVLKYEILYGNRLIKGKFVTASVSEKDPTCKIKSITADTENNRLFITERTQNTYTIKIYNLQGEFAGQYLGKDLFLYKPGSVALYATGPNTGYIVAVDQNIQDNTFHVFDRQTLQYYGAFKGAGISNTNNIVITQTSFGSFAKGAFYAINNKTNIAAIAWENIGHALNLK